MRKPALLLLSLMLVLTAFPGRAAAVPFEDDYARINQAAGSVLMLLVYDATGDDYFATGSGFVAFDGRTLITNYHVVEGGNLVMAESDDGRAYFLDEVLAADKGRDLAILRFKAPTGLAPLPLNREGGWLRGQPVVAIGSPEGYRNTVSKGDISSLFTEDGLPLIQFTAPISHGSSGGALFDNQGRVIGITSSSVMGDSQNMNFAIDIREAIALYEGADKEAARPLAELDSSAARAASAGPAEPPARNDGTIKDFTVRQSRPDAAELTWADSLPRAGEYYIGYEIEGNTHFYYESTSQKRLVVEDLVPGQAYRFFIARSLEGLDSPAAETRLLMDAPRPLNHRGARVLHLGLRFVRRGAIPQVPLQEGLRDIRQDQLLSALQDRELSFVYRLAMDAAAEPSDGNCLYVLTTPGGFLYAGEFFYSFDAGADAYLRRADLRGILADILEYEGEFPTGGWQAAVYHDGSLLGSVAFQVTPGAASGEGSRLTAFASDGDARLSWAALPGADHYLVYRANSANGHYFYLDASQEPSFTDTRVVSGREYHYKVSAVVAGETRELAGPIALRLPLAGEAADAEQAGADWPLAIGDMAYVGDKALPYIDPDLVNRSQGQTVTGFTLAFYAEDANYMPLPFGETSQYISTASFQQVIRPGETKKPGSVSLKRYGGAIENIYVAIVSITLSDGSVLTIPRDEQIFDSWTMNEP